VLRELVPASVCVAAGPLLVAQLTAHERNSIGPVNDCRLREFASGRIYAKRALAMLGVADAELAAGTDRQPLWPEGAVGSISHITDPESGGYFAAAVAPANMVRKIGIDAEFEDRLHPHIWPQVLTKRELSRLTTLASNARRAEALCLWCAKEATIKVVGQPIDPADIDIEHVAEQREFTAKITGRNPIALPKKMIGRIATSQGLVFAIVVILREPSG